MLRYLVYSVTLLGSLGSTMDCPTGNCTTPTGVVTGFTDTAACIDGVRHAVAHEIKSGQNRSIQEIKTGQAQTVQEIRRHQEQTSMGQQRMQEQLTALQRQLIALQPLQPAQDLDCPAGWSRHKNSCYLIPPQQTTWYLALHDCAKMDSRARLASVHPASSQHIEALVAASHTARVWLGLVRLADNVDAGWVWSDGTPLDYTNWAQGEPNNWRGIIENCGQMSGPRYGGPHGWNDYACSSSINFMCQIGQAQKGKSLLT